MNPGMQIRRKFPRIPAENLALVKRLSPGASEGFARTSVLGMGGCALSSDEAYAPGDGVEILISVHGRILRAFGKIVYERDRGDGLRDAGVEFLWLSGEDRDVLRNLFQAPSTVFPEA